jgi:beta-galactosidase
MKTATRSFQNEPGQLSKLAGVEVQEYFAANEDIPVKGNWFNGISRTWAEILNIVDDKTTLTVARYGEGTGWFDNQVAISVKAVRSGMIYCLGLI